MIIDKNYEYESISESLTKPTFAHRILLEVLSSCSFQCEGCFVNRSNSFVESDLKVLQNLMSDLRLNGTFIDELVLGPVDILGASNRDLLFQNSVFLDLMETHKPILAMVSTFMSTDDVLLDFIDLLNSNIKHSTEIEFGIVLDPKLISMNDRVYIDKIKSKINLLNKLKHPVTYTAKLNIGDVANYNLEQLYERVRQEWDTIIDFVPSFFRNRNIKAMDRHLTKWNMYLESEVTDSNKNKIITTIADNSHSSYNYNTWIFSKGDLFFSPFIYDNVVSLSERFKITKVSEGYNYTDLISKLDLIWKESSEYLGVTSECSECSRAFSCMAKGITYFMKSHELTSCILPKKILKLYGDDLGTQAKSFYDWSDYSIENEIKYGIDYSKFSNKKLLKK